ncbi:MAG TPA: cation:proton antiporter [Pseudonocardiaceae bacterium]
MLSPTDPHPRAWRTWVGVVSGVLALAGAAVVWGGDAVRGGGMNPLTRFLVAVAVVLLVCHLCGELLRRLGQPPVLGEIVGGLLLGPSALGLASPGAQAWLFPSDVLVHLDRAAQLGLIVFMFLLGCELRTDALGGGGSRGRWVLGSVVAGSMGLPLLAGMGVALLSGGVLAGDGASFGSYVVFVGLALAITALPVLGRILVDLRMSHTPVGAISLSAAAIGDGLAWTVLAVILTASHHGGSWTMTAGLAVAFVLFVALCVRPALALLERWSARRGGDGEQVLLGVLVVGAIACGAATEVIGLHPVLGAFLFGTAVPRGSVVVEQLSRRMRGFAVAVLLPLFFAGVGLKTSVGLLGSDPVSWLVLAGVLTAAVSAKLIGAGGGARLAGLPTRESLQIGTLMNCRGITELVVATIGLQYGLISPLGFTVLVLVAVITTAATGPLMRLVSGREPKLVGQGLSDKR